VRLLYTNNPFYAISAALVFWGLRISFDTSGTSFATTALMVGLAAYTLLLAGTAYVLIRLGTVWNDVRTILLLVVLMFLATSVALDESLAADPRQGIACYLAGLMFAVALSEGLLHGSGMRLRLLFRGPYYLALALFYLYPVALTPLLSRPNDPLLHWALFGFSPAAALVALTLLPAVSRGPGYIQPSGTPWQWAWYPWTLFFVLGLGVCMRAYYLCLSFHFVGAANNLFGFYFLVPFLLAVNWLLLELGISGQSRWTQAIALAMPLVLLMLAVSPPYGDVLYVQFLTTFMATLGGSPLFFTLVAVIVFYAWAALRQVPGAMVLLSLAAGGLSLVVPQTTDWDHIGPQQGAPLVAVGLMHAWWAMRRRASWHAVLAASAILGGLAIDLQGTRFMAYGGIVPAHLLLAALLAIGLIFEDELAMVVQAMGAWVLLLAGLFPLVDGHPWIGTYPWADLPPLLAQCYPLLVAAAALVYGYLSGETSYYTTAAVIVVGWLAMSAWLGYLYLRTFVRGLDQLLGGAVFFLVALAISLWKARVPQKLLAHRRQQAPR
jgi:hypothetical protein